MREMQHGMVVDGHLGGYIPGGDPATYYPALWDWFVDEHDVRRVVDIGCGDGVALNHWERRLGRDAVLGIDGIDQPDDDRIIRWDFATDGDPVTEGVVAAVFDLAWSCEFLEHVEAQHVGAYMTLFRLSRLAAVTHAMPGQAGWHHVNCQPAEYWIGLFAANGLVYDPDLTQTARTIASMNPDPHNHFVRSGLVFRNARELPR